MAVRTHTYYWAAVTSNRRNVLQFTLEGVEQKWGDILEEFGTKITRIYWLPFDHEMAATLLKSKIPFWPSIQNVPPLWLDIPQGEIGIPLQTFDQEVFTYWRCENCKGTMAWYDSTIELVCPNCGATNEWWCHHCQKVIDEPRYLPKGKVECPICALRGEPYGLRRTKALTDHQETIYRAVYSLVINNKYAIEYDERGQKIRKYKVGNLI